jgi:hypothetical protein
MADYFPPPGSTLALGSTIVSERTTGLAATVGVGATAAHVDHSHGNLATPTVNVQAAQGTTASVTYTATLAGSTAANLAVVIPTSGVVLVILTVDLLNTTAGNKAFASIACSGTDTVAASDAWAKISNSGAANDDRATSAHLFTGLTPGATDTFTAQFKATAGTTQVNSQELIAIPL